MKLFASAVALALALATPAAAQTATDVTAAADPAPAALCTDRPTKSYYACTVPAGAIQIESDIVNWTTTTQGSARSDVVLYANPTLKLGIGDATDIEVNVAPYETVRTRDGSGVDRIGGVGDVYLRLKQRLTDSTGKVQVSLLPYVKAPTARLGVGDGAWEGGLAVPVNVTLPSSFTLTFSPEVDVLENGAGDGRHTQLIGTVNLAHPIGTKVTAYAELWTAQNLDPAGNAHQYSLDGALAYALTPLVQLDAGANIGFNRATPDAQLYLGISTRF